MTVRHHIRVLAVDGDPSAGKTIALVLNELGYRTDRFSDPEQAVEEARKRSHPIALVNLRMPEASDGLSVVRRLKAIDPHMWIIVTTTYPVLDTAIEMMRAGASDYLARPLKQEELAAAVDRGCRSLGLIYTSEDELSILIGQRIRTERVRRHMTLRQIAERTDLTLSQLSQAELARNAASIWALARIGNALGIRISTLLSGL